VRRILWGIVIALVAAGCRDAGALRPLEDASAGSLQVLETPSPFDEVNAGSVHGLIPDRWQPVPTAGSPHQGFYASPRPNDLSRMDGSVAGMAAMWIDVADVGVPSDYYYLAAAGPALRRLTSSDDCHSRSERVIVNRVPDYLQGRPNSPGDYVATGRGACTVGATPTRFAYFIAAPGFGPVREVGIPSSGLYVVVAVTRDSENARGVLNTVVRGTRFGNAGVPELIRAAAS
jgi:hypothetical protein